MSESGDRSFSGDRSCVIRLMNKHALACWGGGGMEGEGGSDETRPNAASAMRRTLARRDLQSSHCAPRVQRDIALLSIPFPFLLSFHGETALTLTLSPLPKRRPDNTCSSCVAKLRRVFENVFDRIDRSTAVSVHCRLFLRLFVSPVEHEGKARNVSRCIRP